MGQSHSIDPALSRPDAVFPESTANVAVIKPKHNRCCRCCRGEWGGFPTDQFPGALQRHIDQDEFKLRIEILNLTRVKQERGATFLWITALVVLVLTPAFMGFLSIQKDLQVDWTGVLAVVVTGFFLLFIARWYERDMLPRRIRSALQSKLQQFNEESSALKWTLQEQTPSQTIINPITRERRTKHFRTIFHLEIVPGTLRHTLDAGSQSVTIDSDAVELSDAANTGSGGEVGLGQRLMTTSRDSSDPS